MRRTTAYVIACLFTAVPLGSAPALADSTFTIEDPPVDCEVVDAEPFDGIGDNGPYATFNDALLGTEGECRSMAEFDISPFTVPPGEIISAATLEVMITAIDISGLGVNGETPESLAVDGYVGNGLEELSDFEAGDGNHLDSIPTPDPEIGQILEFDVTSFVADLVDAQEQYVGLTVRAVTETVGGLWVTEGDGFPKLTIKTILEPSCCTTCMGDMQPDCDGIVNVTDFTVFALAFPSTSADPNYDICADVAPAGGDGFVNITDFTAWAVNFPGPCP